MKRFWIIYMQLSRWYGTHTSAKSRQLFGQSNKFSNSNEKLYSRTAITKWIELPKTETERKKKQRNWIVCMMFRSSIPQTQIKTTFFTSIPNLNFSAGAQDCNFFFCIFFAHSIRTWTVLVCFSLYLVVFRSTAHKFDNFSPKFIRTDEKQKQQLKRITARTHKYITHTKKLFIARRVVHVISLRWRIYFDFSHAFFRCVPSVRLFHTHTHKICNNAPGQMQPPCQK